MMIFTQTFWKWTKTVSLFLAIYFLLLDKAVATNYYMKATGNASATATWGTNTDGSGTSPTNFTTAGNTFNVSSTASGAPTTFTTGAAWTVTGTGSGIIIPAGNTLNVTVGNTTIGASANVAAFLACNGSITGGTLVIVGASSSANAFILSGGNSVTHGSISVTTFTINNSGTQFTNIASGTYLDCGSIAVATNSNSTMTNNGVITCTTFTCGASCTNTNSLTCSGTFTMNNGSCTFTNSNGATLNCNNAATSVTYSNGTSFTNNGTCTCAGLFNYTSSGGAQFINSGTLSCASFTESGGSALFTNNGSFTCTGAYSWSSSGSTTFVNNSGGTVTIGSFDLSSSGAQNVVSNSGTLNDNGVLTLTSGTTTNFNNASTGVVNVAGTIALGSSHTFSNTGKVFSTASTGITGANATSSIWNNNAGAYLQIVGPILSTGALNTATTDTIRYKSSTLAQTVKTATYGHLVIDNSGQTATLGGAITVNSNLTITSAGSLDASASNFNITMKGNWNNSGAYNTRSNTVTFSGTSAESINGASSTTFNSLTINNASGVTLNAPANTTALTLTSGNLATTSTNIITVTGTATTNVVRTSGYVNGPIIRRLPAGLSASSTYLFPIGKGTYNPFELINPATNAGGTVDLKTEVFDGSSGGTAGVNMVSLNTDHYWNASITTGGANFTSSSARLTQETALGAANGIGQSATQTGSYDFAGSNSVNNPVNTITTDVLSSLAFFVLGTRNPTAPTITYTDITDQVCSTPVTLSATITDANGINTTSGVKPRLWYKKNTEANVLPASNISASNGWKYVETTSSNSPFSFTINYSLLTGAPATGDSIQYFVVAQNSLNNVGTNTATYSTTPPSVALSSGAFPVSGTKAYAILSANYTSSAGTHGTISPLGSTTVSCGTIQSYTITPDSCYHVADVLVDGNSVGAVTSYSFGAANGSHTISATFALTVYTVTATAGPNGTISPSGSISVNCGDTIAFTITPDPFYIISDVQVDGGSVGPVSSYTFSTVGANHTINASFTISVATVCSGTPVSCNGGSNGTASVSASGGTPPYTYLWTNSSTDASITGLSAGTYTVTVTDNSGAQATCSFNVTQPSTVTAACSGTNGCNGANNGTASVIPSGGTPGYTYLWSTTETTSSISNLSPAIYSVTVTDSHSCTGVSSYTVVDPPALTASSAVVTNVTCNGGSNGSASVSASGGTPPYSGTGTFPGLNAGSHSFIVTDANGCTASTSVIITEPSAVTATCVVVTNVACHGGSNGSVSVSGSGGNPPYTGEGLFTGLSAGLHSYTVTDASGCTGVCSITVTEPAVLVASCSGSGVSCNGGSNGTAAATPAGGTSPYSYSWSTTETTASINGLAIGTYFVTITDSHNCTASCAYTVTQPATLSVSCSGTHISCLGGSNGTATVAPSGGTSPYAYHWSNGGTTSSVTGLIAGSYSVTVTDSHGCTASCSITLTEPATSVAVSATSNSPVCELSVLNLSSSGSGGTGAISYIWAGSNGFLANIQNPTISSTVLAAAGTYNVTATDANGCTATTTISVTIQPIPVAPTITASGPTTFCHADSVILTSSGSGPYLWSTGATTSSIIVKAAGAYTVRVTVGVNGCGPGYASAATIITVNPQPTAFISGGLEYCHGGSTVLSAATADPGIGTITGYQWNLNGNPIGGAIASNYTATAPGNYSVTITNSAGCSSTVCP